MSDMLRDKQGRPLPFRMSPETWEDMKACTTFPHPSAPDTIMGIPVELHPHIARGVVLQFNLDVLTEEDSE